jgi:hypothetical protein
VSSRRYQVADTVNRHCRRASMRLIFVETFEIVSGRGMDGKRT